MKRAFSLVELIGIIIIIGIIGMVSVPIVNNTIKNGKEKAYDTQVASIIVAAEKWGVKNVELLPNETDELYISIDTLISSGLLENSINGKIKNPIDDSDMNGCVYVVYSNEYNQYIYEYKEVCR